MGPPHLRLALLLAPAAWAQTPPGEAPVPVTFSEHVAPIVNDHCVECHRPGEAAPFPLGSFDAVRRRGKMILQVVEDRYMPPWHPVAGHGEFADERRLSADEIDVLRRWVAGGMAEGDPARLPPFPHFVDGWQLGQPDLVVIMPRAFEVPASGPDIYRNFVVPLELGQDRWLAAIEVRPSARSVLHHVIFAIDTTGSARRRDGADGQPGFRGMGAGESLGTSTEAVGGWAVGGIPRRLPLGLARLLPAGADLVLRSHFHPSGKVESEQTTLGLFFASEPPKRSMVGLQLPPAFGVAAGLDVPAGEARFALEDRFVLPVDVLAVEVGGHAHYICREMQVWATDSDGRRSSVFWIDDWDFNWQNRYQYREPLALAAGTTIDVRLLYDNSAANPRNPFDPPRRIRWGLQSTDEMGSITLLLVPADEADAARLRRAVQRHRSDHFAQARRDGRARGALASQVWMLDLDGDGRITADEMPERRRALLLRADRNGDGALDADEVEAAIARLGAVERRR